MHFLVRDVKSKETNRPPREFDSLTIRDRLDLIDFGEKILEPRSGDVGVFTKERLLQSSLDKNYELKQKLLDFLGPVRPSCGWTNMKKQPGVAYFGGFLWEVH